MKNRGITLIALIVTIILLLILSGVVINLALGEHGIIGMAKQAGEEYKIASIKERVEQEILALDADKTTKGETLTVEQALVELEKKETFSEIDLAEETGMCEGYLIKLGYDEFGNVVIEGVEQDTGTRLVTEVTPKGYTKEDVTVTISIKPDTVKISNIEVPDGMTKQEDGTYKIAKNGTYHVKAILEEGEPIEKDIKIDTIDKLPPKDFTITTENTGEGFIITGITQDEEDTKENACSGIDYYEYVVIDKDGKETTYTESEIKGLGVGTYQIYAIAYDKAKNPKQTEAITAEVKLKLKFSKVSAGRESALGIDLDGRLWAWGLRGYSGLGINGHGPVHIVDGVKFRDVCAGDENNFAIDVDGNLWSWGYNSNGEVGDGTRQKHYTPSKVKEGLKFKQVDFSEGVSGVIDINGLFWRWGKWAVLNYRGSYVLDFYSATPQRWADERCFESIALGKLVGLGIDSSGQLWCWGNCTTTNNSFETQPTKVKEGTKFSYATVLKGSSSRNNCFAIDLDGNLWFWGVDALGNSGTGLTDEIKIPVQVKEDTQFKKISGFEYNCVAIDVDGNLWSWGYGRQYWGSLIGDGVNKDREIPIKIKEDVKFKEISMGADFCLAIDINGNLWSWGNNSSGQLGDGTTTSSSIPIKVF